MHLRLIKIFNLIKEISTSALMLCPVASRFFHNFLNAKVKEKMDLPEFKDLAEHIREIIVDQNSDDLRAEIANAKRLIKQNLNFEKDIIGRLSDHMHILLIYAILDEDGKISKLGINPATLIDLLVLGKYLYNPNPFHNYEHVLGVLYTSFHLITNMNVVLTDLEWVAYFLGCYFHDVLHLGMDSKETESYLTSSLSEGINDLELEYGFNEVLHSECVLHILTNFMPLVDSINNHNNMRMIIKEIILATDLSKHDRIVQMVSSDVESLENKKRISLNDLKLLIKIADLAGTGKDFPYALSCGFNVWRETFSENKLRSLADLNCNERIDFYKSQVCFYKAFPLKLFEMVSYRNPALYELVAGCRNNIDIFRNLIRELLNEEETGLD